MQRIFNGSSDVIPRDVNNINKVKSFDQDQMPMVGPRESQVSNSNSIH